MNIWGSQKILLFPCVTLVWLFSTKCFQISPKMSCLTRGKLKLSAFVWFLHCAFSNVSLDYQISLTKSKSEFNPPDKKRQRYFLKPGCHQEEFKMVLKGILIYGRVGYARWGKCYGKCRRPKSSSWAPGSHRDLCLSKDPKTTACSIYLETMD